MYDQITVVVGIDAKTIEYLKVSCETWRLNRPEMWRMPWVLFCDWTVPGGLTIPQVDQMMTQLAVPDLKVVMWPGTGVPRSSYETQRELMLSGHVWVPGEHVKTPWHMKVDVDTLAQGPSEWLHAEWFEPREEDGKLPAYVAPRWGYTKGVNFLGRLEDWGDGIVPYRPRLGIPFDPSHLRVPHQRMCSWVSYYRTDFTRRLCHALEGTVGRGRLPIPSQDSVAWYAAERMGEFYRIVSQKPLRWNNYPKLPNLIEAAKQVMSANLQASMVDG